MTSEVSAPWRAALRRWYRRDRRDLPWRRTRDPYRVWVSEAMLQQTRVSAATPFYQRFIERFPSLEVLASVRESEVLAAWAGLGYYRRARHLHEAARCLVRENGGEVPNDPVTFGSLPGVGRYTTAAVLSICFDRPLAVLDGNVARVLSRLYAMDVTIREPPGARALWELAQSLIPGRQPGDWNQALMEFGATVCTPRAPRCASCPLRRWCRAHATGRVDELPRAAHRRPVELQRRAVALIERRGRVLMARRDGALLEGLWEPPGVDVRRGEQASKQLRRELIRLGVRASLEATRLRLRHTITFRRIDVQLWRGTLAKDHPPRSGCRWIDPAREGVGMTALARKAAGILKKTGRLPATSAARP